LQKSLFEKKNYKIIKSGFRKRTKEEEKTNKVNDGIPKKRRKICTVRKKEMNANDPNEAMLQVIQVHHRIKF